MSNKNILRWYNDSDAVRSPLDRRWAAEGIGYVDYSTDRSFESKDSDRPKAAGQAFNALEAISNEGGIGALRAGGSEFITVGRYKTNCLGLFTPDNAPTLKCAQMDTYGIIDPTDSVYNRLDALFEDGSITVRHSVDPSLIEDALHLLDDQYRLRTPV